MYQLRVQHHFTASIVPGTPHCGLDDDPGPHVYHYQVDIHADALNESGFVVDNMDVVRYFAAITRIDCSCETLCSRAAADLWRPSFTRLEVRIHGTTFASVSCAKVRTRDADSGVPLPALPA